MSIKWNSVREEILVDPEIAKFYQESDEEFEEAKKVAREKRNKILDHNGFTALITKLDTCYCATDIKYNNEKIKDVLSAHGENIKELELAFKAVVDDYLDWLTEE